MFKNKAKIRHVAQGFSMVFFVEIFLACNPADSLKNQEYRPYLENYEDWHATEIVEAFNYLDSKKSSFSCKNELESARRAVWREKAGPVKVSQTISGRKLRRCLEDFHVGSGLKQGKIQSAILSDWVNHNFISEIKAKIDTEVAKAQKRLDSAGCGGKECEALTVVGDLAVPRAGQEVAVAWRDAKAQCAAARFGGVGPWRLPTKGELVTLRQSNKLASDQDFATYWSGTREFDEQGNVKAWVMRFDVESLSQALQPQLVGMEKDGRPNISKVRCVYSFTKSAPSKTKVDEMEQNLARSGCPRNEWDPQGYSWEDYVRIKNNLLISWKNLNKSGPKARSVCKKLGWCKLRWRKASRADKRAFSDDAWLSSTIGDRCIALLPIQNPTKVPHREMIGFQ